MSAAEPTGDLKTALNHAARLLDQDAALAEAQCREILEAVPGFPSALLILGAALTRQGQAAAARDILSPLAAKERLWPEVQFELGLALARLGKGRAAIEALRAATALKPADGRAWRALADQLRLAGRSAEADAAVARHLQASANDPRLMAAAAALVDEKLVTAEQLLREFLKRHPTDVAAIRMLAEVGTRLGRYGDVENLLVRCLELAPGFAAARHNYALVLYRQGKAAEALAELDRLLAADPSHPAYLNLQAAALGRIGEYDRALGVWERMLERFPEQPKAWMSYGHALKTVGRAEESVAAYRRAVALTPHLGEAWWSLANLKTWAFAEEDVATIERELARPDLDDEDRLHLDFALGKALEDRRAWEASFAAYARGNALRKPALGYDPDETSAAVERAIALFTPGFLAARAGQGCEAPDPIFVVGLPRSGSTLVEQILASHSEVEGTMELPDLIAIAHRLGGKDQGSAYPACLAGLGPGALKALGEEYLERTRVQRKTARPRFIDKMPNNWLHIGLIALILPNAKIVDARRHPMATGFSGFKQHFARGQGFTYDLDWLGRYWSDYARLTAHFDAVAPGRVHRVIHERLVEDPEAEVRALLAHCGLSFEPACLRPHETERAVRTASSEQVRRPISAEALDHWRNYETWLGPLKAALGAHAEAYPA